jgi:hypothetical protein
MKVIKIDDEDTKLTKRQRQKVAILKLTENGKYLEGVGIKDNEFFLLTEGDDDEEYLAYMHMGRKPTNLTRDKTIQAVLMIIKEREIRAVKAALKGEEPPEW